MVSWIFLACAVWGALWTWISFHPPRRPSLLMFVGFFAAWTTTELAPLHVLWQVGAVAVFIWLGALEHWAGWLALAVTFVSWFGLSASVKGSLQTDRVFTAALAETGGDDWDASLDPQLEAAGRRVSWRRIALPFWFKHKGVKRIRNIQYVDDGNRRHRLDVYRHESTAPGAPVLLQIHGGGWVIGNKDQQGHPLMNHLAARGWVCVAINYRLSPRATWPDHLVDCKRALAWIREHIAEYGGDPGYVVVTGGSAGGHLTAMMGLTANDPQYHPGFEEIDTTVQAMIPFYGVFDWTGKVAARPEDGLREILERFIVKQKYEDAPELYASASPYFRITPEAPPAMIVHGDLDTLAPCAEARAFVTKLREVSKQPVVYVELAGAHHAFEIYNSIRAMHAIAGVDLFLAWLVSASSARDAAGGSSPSAAVPIRSEEPAAPVNDPRSTAHTGH